VASFRCEQVGEAQVEERRLGRRGPMVSVVGLGTWQLGGDWGDVSEAGAREVLETSAEAGVTFFDTADVYGDGRSEQVLGRFLAEHRGDGLTVATKMGRRQAQTAESYTSANFRSWVDRSRRNLGLEQLPLVQLHCPPSAVIESDATYDALDALVDDGSIAAYGVSVETADQALAAIARPHVRSVQVILNAFRLKPLDRVLPAALERGVGIVARLPLASGLLAARYDRSTTFSPDDHRTYNRDGAQFDVGETFSGVDFATGVEAAQEFARLCRERGPYGVSPAQAAIAWVWQQPGVTTVIPGARNAGQARSNAAAGRLASLDETFLQGVHELYDRFFRKEIHHRW
jgi:aryl-alcohol dehydrogenase-like predicted oxidoreductase